MKMIANNRLHLILEDGIFIDLCKSFRIKSVYCNDNLFVFGERFSFIVYDSVNDFDMEYVFYDRYEKKYIHGIYAILKIVTDSNRVVEFTGKEFEGINFHEINISLLEKKKSFSVFLSIIESFGDTIFADGLDADDDFFTKAIHSVSTKWESCMNDV